MQPTLLRVEPRHQVEFEIVPSDRSVNPDGCSRYCRANQDDSGSEESIPSDVSEN
jgi:hypothetical protein